MNIFLQQFLWYLWFLRYREFTYSGTVRRTVSVFGYFPLVGSYISEMFSHVSLISNSPQFETL